MVSIVEGLVGYVAGMPVWAAALLLGGVAAALTSLGGLVALLGERARSPKVLDAGLGFSSGVMLVASFTSLLLPALEMGGFAGVAAGFLAGVAVIAFIERLTPHLHVVKGLEGGGEAARRLKAVWLVALAIIIHNLPEGLAIGFSAVAGAREGVLVALAIGLQDVPEGMAVALPVLASTGSPLKALGVAALSGVSEMLMSGLAGALGEATAAALPYSLAFAAGAMVYVVSHEALPESHRAGHENEATLGFLLGFLVMLWLDTTLG